MWERRALEVPLLLSIVLNQPVHAVPTHRMGEVSIMGEALRLHTQSNGLLDLTTVIQ